MSAATRPDAGVGLVSATRGAHATEGRCGLGHPMCNRHAGSRLPVGMFQAGCPFAAKVIAGKFKT